MKIEGGTHAIRETKGRTILLKKQPILSFDNFLERIFFKTRYDLIPYAESFLDTIKVKGLHATEWREFFESHNMKQSQYNSIRQRLHALGLIRKTDGKWLLSRQFSTNLRNLADYWDAWIQEEVKR